MQDGKQQVTRGPDRPTANRNAAVAGYSPRTAIPTGLRFAEHRVNGGLFLWTRFGGGQV